MRVYYLKNNTNYFNNYDLSLARKQVRNTRVTTALTAKNEQNANVNNVSFNF